MEFTNVVKQSHKRIFLQNGAARPNNRCRYAGQDAQYLALQGVSRPITGGSDPIRVPDPRRIGKFRTVGRTSSAPDMASATLQVMEDIGAIPFVFGDLSCPLNIYVPTGKCRDLSDFASGWESYVEIYGGCQVDDVDLGDRTGWDSDDRMDNGLSLTIDRIYAVGALSFGEQAATNIATEVIDVTYGAGVQCGDCGPANDGTQLLYALAKTTGAAAGKVVWSNDGGATWTDAAVTGLGATELVYAIHVVGSNLVVLGTDAYYWAPLSTATGAPGTWAKVTTGFVATKSPRDMFVAGPNAVYFVGLGGYIYSTTDITAGVTVMNAGSATSQDLGRIHGTNDVLVAVGAAGAVVASVNAGRTWALTAAPAAVVLGAVAVLDAYRYWVGGANGNVYYTLNGGATWATQNFPGSGAGSVADIVFATDEVGYISHTSATPTARLFSTWNGGANWSNVAPRLLNLPTFNRANRIAVPDGDPTVMANNVALAGLSGGGTDGILLLGIAAVK